jgi:hypothetical protein
MHALPILHPIRIRSLGGFLADDGGPIDWHGRFDIWLWLQLNVTRFMARAPRYSIVRTVMPRLSNVSMSPLVLKNVTVAWARPDTALLKYAARRFSNPQAFGNTRLAHPLCIKLPVGVASSSAAVKDTKPTPSAVSSLNITARSANDHPIDQAATRG